MSTPLHPNQKANAVGHILSCEHFAIVDHTINRAAGCRYCGDGRHMDELVAMGYMRPLGSFLGNPYFTVTASGREAYAKAKGVQ